MDKWWKSAVVYQIYLRSFCDSNGDGIGDFRGVISKLDYLTDLGVDIIWLSPFCKSPNDDNGYDISDYYDVNPEYGDMSDLEALVNKAGEHGIKIMMDLVLNHTSDEHPWFIESRKSKDNPKRDWYIWKEGGIGDGASALPNNWDSYFGGSVWELDKVTGEYYMHIFSTKQPDLNWANKKVREEMYRVAEFWIKKGIKAFRLDAVHHIGKPSGYPDADLESGEFKLYKNIKETHDYLREMNERIFKPYGILTVGETGGTTPKNSGLYVNEDRAELDMIFHFEHTWLSNMRDGGLLLDNLNKWYKSLHRKGWDTQFFSNHDLPRQVSVYGDDGPFRKQSAMAIASLLLTAWGTPYIYQGEEIGMGNVYFDNITDYRDRHAVRGYEISVENGEHPELAYSVFQARNRDNSRTPFRWDNTENYGFTTGKPWIGTGSGSSLDDDLNSSLSVSRWYKELIKLRKEYAVFSKGDFKPVGKYNSNYIIYSRKLGGMTALVVISWSSMRQIVKLPAKIRGVKFSDFKLIKSSYDTADLSDKKSQNKGAGDFSDLLASSGKSGNSVNNISLKQWEVRIYVS